MENKIEKTPNTGIIDRLLTQAEVQALTGLSASTLEQYRAKGKGIAWVRATTRAIRYRESAVIEYLASLTGSTPMQENNGAMP